MTDKGWTKFENSFTRSDKFDMYEKALLQVLLTYKNLEEIHPNQDTLSKQTGMSVRQVGRTQQKLKKRGYLSTKKHPSYRSNIYTLTKKAKTHSPTTRTDSPRVPDSQSELDKTDSPTKRNSIKRNNIKEKEKKKPPDVVLPDWLNKKWWAEWGKHNKLKGKKLPVTTIEAQIKKLAKYKKDHVQMIQNAIEANWQSFWPLKENNNKPNNTPSNVLKPEEGKYDNLG